MTGIGAHLWPEIGGVLRLQAGAFADALGYRPYAGVLGLVIVLLATLSQSVGQSVVLFANRVSRGRFIFSLLLDAALLGIGYAFLIVTTWLVLLLRGQHAVAFADLAVVLALSYAPLLFAFIGALPYLGRNLLWALRTWHLLAMVVGVSAVTGDSLFGALATCGFGWVVLSILTQTIGRPIARLGQRIVNAVSGVDLTDSEDIAIDRLFPGGGHATGAVGNAASAPGEPVVAPVRRHQKTAWYTAALGIFVMLVIGYVLALVLAPLHAAVFGWQAQLPRVAQLPLNFLWIALIGVLVAGFMAPVETLGWWAGWYGDEVVTVDEPSAAAGTAAGVTRYVVYLDGISQSSTQYMPDVEVFLDTLTPALPPGVRLVRGVMTYSPDNRPLDQDPVLSAFWTFVDAIRMKNPTSLLGMIVNLRNVWIVAVSADPRYGPMYNYGIAQLVYDALIADGYPPGSGTPVTLLGYSGGGQMAAASGAFLKRALDAPVDVISLGGVISGNCHILELEHLYHFCGTKDDIQRLGPIMFASRWKIARFSRWNRALRLGRITIFSLGPVGHQVPGGMMDPNLTLPDGRTALAQTVAKVTAVLDGRITADDPAIPKKPSNYDRYVGAPWNQPAYYPIGAAVDERHYRPVGAWIGRLILPAREERSSVNGAWFEVHHAPPDHAVLVGTRVKLQWTAAALVDDLVRAVTRDVHFSAQASYASRYGGTINPVRVNHWQLVDPLESLAGSHPADDVIVMLDGAVEVSGDALGITRQPVQITGRYYALVRFEEALGNDRYAVTHFDREAHAFAGDREIVYVPAPVSDTDGRAPSNIAGIERAPLNAQGWYAYGTPGPDGAFVVQALLPRELLALEPERTVAADAHAQFRYLRAHCWPDIVAHKNGTLSVRLHERPWQIGDEALVLHTYGGIGGGEGEKAASFPVYFGHFAFGFARGIEEPLTGEPRFEFDYSQVYCHNVDGLIAGRLHVSRYLGDRQFGWIGARPTCNIIFKDDAFSRPYTLDGNAMSPLNALALQLDAMTARYRIGDGTGATFVSAANNCSQDSGRALFAALHMLGDRTDVPADEAERFRRLVALTAALERKLQTFGVARHDWTDNSFDLGTTMLDESWSQFRSAFGSWRMILPRKASDTIAGTLLEHGAAGWLLGTDQVHDRPELAPVVPMTF